jgi:hypothetical protein
MTVPLRSPQKASPFWIILLLVSDRMDHGPLCVEVQWEGRRAPRLGTLFPGALDDYVSEHGRLTECRTDSDLSRLPVLSRRPQHPRRPIEVRDKSCKLLGRPVGVVLILNPLLPLIFEGRSTGSVWLQRQVPDGVS